MNCKKPNVRKAFEKPDHDGFIVHDRWLYRKLDKKIIKYKGDIYYHVCKNVRHKGTTITTATLLYEIESLSPDKVVPDSDIKVVHEG
jgi:hypothetical protein